MPRPVHPDFSHPMGFAGLSWSAILYSTDRRRPAVVHVRFANTAMDPARSRKCFGIELK